MRTLDFKVKPAEHRLLANGLKVIQYIDNSNPLICIQLHIKTGSIKENDSCRGYSHFIEHLVFKSTSSYPNNLISEIIPKLGGSINAYTDYDSTCYYLMIPSEHLEDSVKILSELAYQSDFSATEVKIEKDIIIEEIKQYENDPEGDFIEYIQSEYFTVSPLKYPVLGTLKSVSNACLTDLREYYSQNYNPDNSFVVVSGSFDQDYLMQIMDQYFGKWENSNARLMSIMAAEENTAFRAQYRFRKGGTNYLGIAMPELAESHPHSDHLLIAMRALAIGKSSRLYKRLVEQEKICSSIKVTSLCGTLPGISIILFCPIGKSSVKRIVDIFAEEYSRIMYNDVLESDFDMIKNEIIHGWVYSFESMENAASTIAAEEFIGDSHKLYHYDEHINAIQLSEIRPVVNEHWKAHTLHIYYQSSTRNNWQELELISDSNIFLNYVDPPKQLLDKLSKKIAVLDRLNSLPNQTTESIKQVTDSYYTITLSNSLRVTYKFIADKPFCGFALATPISQIMEDITNRGINYLTSSAILYGSRQHTYSQIQDITRKHGINLRVIHHLDSTIYRGKCFIGDLDVALKLLSELILYPTFKQTYVSYIKSSTMENIRREDDYPVTYAFKLWQRMLCGVQTNLDNSSGTISQLKTVKRNDLINWHERWNFPDQFELSIVGSLAPEQIYELAESSFGTSPKRDIAPMTHQPLYQSRNSLYRRVNKQNEQAIINLGGFACPSSDVIQNTAFHILSQVIGGDLFSRMFSILREQYGYAYQTGFDFNSITTHGFWNAYIYCDPDNIKPALKVLKSILKDICEHGITAEELQIAQNYLIGMNRFDSESVSWQASSIANLLALGYQLDHYLSREERIRNVQLSDISNTAGKWLKPENHYIHILT